MPFLRCKTQVMWCEAIFHKEQQIFTKNYTNVTLLISSQEQQKCKTKIYFNVQKQDKRSIARIKLQQKQIKKSW